MGMFVIQRGQIRMLFSKGRAQGGEYVVKTYVLLAMLVLVVSRRYAHAGIHPLQLDKNTDDSKCVECHDDKAKGKNVHPAVGMGCQTCHLIRNSGDTTRVNLKTARVSALCFGCHDDKQGTANPRQVHPPAAKDCLKCHDPHNSPNDHLLLKPETGGKGENLCLDCHDQGMNVPDKGTRHAALDMGCDACHVTHKIGKGKTGDQEFDNHLAKAVPALCMDCHDVKDAKLAGVHKGQPFAGANCTECHDPHESKSPHLLAKYLHPPFQDGTCDTCHQPAKDGKVVLNAATPKELCVTCHSDKGDQIEKAKVQHPGAAGDCTDCHSPHGGRYRRFVRPSPVAVCEGCHSEEKDIHDTKSVLHQPAFQQGCAVCHEPHGGDRDHLLRADTNKLCLTCHGPTAAGAKVEGGKDITIFDGAVLLPANYFDQMKHLPLDNSGLGHPEPRHPVGGVVDPSDPKKVKMLTCLSCHVPHGGGTALLVTGTETTGPLCKLCHTAIRASIAPVRGQIIAAARVMPRADRSRP
jgi:predicted CXXCH cytochrome family protein